MEGHRFYDIMRLGITVTRKGGYHFLNNTDLISPSYQDYRTILAIPQSEIDVNPNIKQNEGYLYNSLFSFVTIIYKISISYIIISQCA